MENIEFLLVIGALLIFIAYREWRSEKRVSDLEERMIGPSPRAVRTQKKTGQANEIMNTDNDSVPLENIPFMTIPKEYNIEMEGSPETPEEAAARKKGGG